MQNPQFKFDGNTPTQNIQPSYQNQGSSFPNPNQLKKQTKFDWKFFTISAVIVVAAINFVWWIYPQIDQDTNVSDNYSSQIIFVIIYTIMVAFSFFLSFTSLIKNYWSFIPILFSLLVAANFRSSYNWQIAVLLVMFASLFLLIKIPKIHYKSIFGLLTFSVMAATAVPMAIFFLQHNHVSPSFIQASFPLMISFLFYMSPIFLQPGTFTRIFEIVIGFILILIHFYLGFGVEAILGTLIVAATLVLMNINLRTQYRLPIYTMLLLLDALIMYLQQKN